MCGVFGIIGEYSSSKAREALAKLEHRGRDHCGIVERDRLFLAHQRLSITDVHPRSHQPMASGQVLISFNGEIYNHAALRERLKLSHWETASDTEVILRAYECRRRETLPGTGPIRQKTPLLPSIGGAFYFCVRDQSDQTVSLFRPNE
ncbi:hypothetical protein [Sulfuricurvum sp. MLSB]|uniref:hypothetical protein n=1 Tax=Sulfuricurvum sp. MLSB TaxID=1537917 RepID=UPI000A3DB1BE|nr:hypothetical protein [Sulfuricurvum sp. MLSB]